MRRLAALLGLGLLPLTGAGCALPRVSPPHIVVNREGIPLRVKVDGSYLKLHNNDTFIEEEVQRILERIDDHVLTTPRSQKPPELMIYVHGGLTTYAAGLEFAASAVDQDGFLRGTSLFPLFIVWDSSFATSVTDDLFEIRRGEREPFPIVWTRVLQTVTSPFVVVLSAAQQPGQCAAKLGFPGRSVLRDVPGAHNAGYGGTAGAGL
jgi:hypothetical protein